MPRSPLGPSSVEDLTPKEAEVYAALKPYLDANRAFLPALISRDLRMSRSLFNCYLTRLWRARLIVRIERGHYVWPKDPRAATAPQPTFPAKLPKEIRKAMSAPLTVPGITLAQLMGGRAPRRRHG